MLGSARRKDSGQATRQKFMHKISGGSLDYGYGSKHPMDPALVDDWFFFFFVPSQEVFGSGAVRTWQIQQPGQLRRVWF